MKTKSLKLIGVVILFTLLNLSVKASEFLIKDIVHTYTESEYGWFYWYDMNAYPTNWHSPVDYWNGKIYCRFEVISQGASGNSTEPLNMSYILWDVISGSGDELAGKWNYISGGPGSIFEDTPATAQKLADYYVVGSGIDLHNIFNVKRMGCDVRDRHGRGVSNPNWGYDADLWAQRDKWYPLQVRMTIVAVSSGSSFSGWGNYVDLPSPEIIIYPETQAEVGRLYTLDINTFPTSDVSLSASISPGNESVSINPSNGLLSWTPSETGTYTIEITAVNEAGSATETFNVLVNEPSTRIMPLGNSLTFDQYISDSRDVSQRGGYRKLLAEMLNELDVNFDFVGSESSGSAIMSDPHNAGFPGMTSSQLLHLLQYGYNQTAGVQETPGYYLDAFQPDIILLHIGTNGFSTDVTTLSSILDEIDAYKSRANKNVEVILAQIINRAPFHSPTSTYNQNIANLISQRGDPDITLLDMENDAGLSYEIYPSGDMHDLYHPSTEGFEKMAQAWLDELFELVSTPPSTPVFVKGNDITSDIHTEIHIDFHAVASEKPSYSIVSGSPGMTIDPEYGVLNWSPSSTGTYPVTVQATTAFGSSTKTIEIRVVNTKSFGNLEKFSNTVTNANRRAQPFTMPENGNIESITMYHSPGSGNLVFAVYADDGGLPGQKLAQTPVTAAASFAGWQTVALETPTSLTTGDKFWLAWIYENPPVIYYTNGSPGRAHSNATYSGGMPSDFGSSTTSDLVYSIYMTYSLEGTQETPPLPPYDFILTENPGSGIGISWSHNQINTDGYVVYRSLNGEDFAELATLNELVLNYTDNTAGEPGIYKYYVAAYNENGISQKVDEATIIISDGGSSEMTIGYTDKFPLEVYSPYRRAQQVTVSENGYLQEISMYHGGGSGYVVYAVYADNGGSPGTVLALTSPTAKISGEGWQTISLTELVPVLSGQKIWLAWLFSNNTKLFYQGGTPGRAGTDEIWDDGMPQEFAATNFGDYIYSINATLITGSSELPPASPSSLAVALNKITPSASLTWIDNADNESTYHIERSADGFTYSEITTLAPNSTSWIDNTVTNSKYYYRVWASNEHGSSTYSNVVEADLTSTTPPESENIGYESVMSNVVYNANRRALPVTIPYDAALESISMYHGGTTGNLIYGVYSDDNGTPGELIGQTGVMPASSQTGWQEVELSTPVNVEAGQVVWLTWIYENSTAIYYQTGTPGRAHSDTYWTGGLPVTYGSSSIKDIIYSIYATITTADPGPPSAPAAPSDLNITLSGTSSVDLTWTDNSSNEESFVLMRSINSESWTLLTTLTVNTESYTDNVGITDIDVKYRIKAVNSIGGSVYAVSPEIYIPEPSSIAIAGNNTVFASNTYNGFLRAQKTTMPETGTLFEISMYHGPTSGNVVLGIYDDNSGSPGDLIASTGIVPGTSSTGWQHANLISPVNVPAGEVIWLAWVFEYPTSIYYRNGGPGRAHSDSEWAGDIPSNFGTSSIADYEYSIYASYTTEVPETPPAAPSELTAIFNPATRSANLSWTDNSLNEESFVVQTSENGGVFADLSSVGPNTTVLEHNGLQLGNTYEYRVKAENGYGESGYSNLVSILATDAPPPPVSEGFTEVFDQEVYSAFRRAQQVSISGDGTMESITMYHGGGSGNLLYGVYTDENNAPGTLIAETEISPVNPDEGWQEVSLSTPLAVSAGEKFWLAWVYSNAMKIVYTDGIPGRAHTSDFWTGSLPALFNAESYADYIYSIYANVIPTSIKRANEAQPLTASEAIRIFPNPARNGQFVIELLKNSFSDETITIEILDASGRLLHNELHTQEHRIQIDLGNIRPQLVYVKLITQEEMVIEPVLLR